MKEVYFRSKKQDRDTLSILYRIPPAIKNQEEYANIVSGSLWLITKTIEEQNLRASIFEKLADDLPDGDINKKIWRKQQSIAEKWVEKLENAPKRKNNSNLDDIKKQLSALKAFKQNGDEQQIEELESLIKTSKLDELKARLGESMDVKKKIADSSLVKNLKTTQQFMTDSKFRSFAVKRGVNRLGKAALGKVVGHGMIGDFLGVNDITDNSLAEDYSQHLGQEQMAKQFREEYSMEGRAIDVKPSTLSRKVNKQAESQQSLEANMDLSRDILEESDDTLMDRLDKQFSKIAKKLGSSKGILDSITGGLMSHRKLLGTVVALLSAIAASKLFSPDEAKADTVSSADIDSGLEDEASEQLTERVEIKQDSLSGMDFNSLTNDYKFGTPGAFTPTSDKVNPQLNADKEETRKKANAEASKVFGSNKELMYVNEGIMSMESGFRNNAQNPLSSAKGTHQFLNSTWLDQIKKHADEYSGMLGVDAETLKGIKSTKQGSTTGNYELDQKLISLKSDASISGRIGADFMMDNKKWYEEKYGEMGPENYKDLYAMHHYGQGDYKFFKDNSDKDITSSKSYWAITRSNPWIAQSGARTGQDMIDLVTTKVQGHIMAAKERDAGSTQLASATTPITPTSDNSSIIPASNKTSKVKSVTMASNDVKLNPPTNKVKSEFSPIKEPAPESSKIPSGTSTGSSDNGGVTSIPVYMADGGGINIFQLGAPNV